MEITFNGEYAGSYVDEAVRLIEAGKSVEEIGDIVEKSPRTISDRLRERGYRSNNGVWAYMGDQFVKGGVKPETKPETKPEAKPVTVQKKTGSVDDENLSAWLLTLYNIQGDLPDVSFQIPTDLVEELTAVSEKLRFTKSEVVILALREFIDQM